MDSNRRDSSDARQRVERAKNRSLRQTGVVDSINEDGTVKVRLSSHNHVSCDISMPVVGDDYYPQVGDVVQVKQRMGRIPMVVGVGVGTSNERRRVSESGERVIGHPTSDSRIEYTADGNLEHITEPFDEDVKAKVIVGIDGSISYYNKPTNDPPQKDPYVQYSEEITKLGQQTARSAIEIYENGTISLTTQPPNQPSTMTWQFAVDGTTTLTVPPNGTILTFDADGMHFANEQVVTDVETSTDGDGHVTDVSPVYTTSISL